MSIRALSVLLLLLAAFAPAAAQNPPVSLKVTAASPEEAAAALSRASGVRVEIVHPGAARKDPAAPPIAPAPAIAAQRASFDWTNTTFARALRQLCERYALAPGRSAEGVYRLAPAPAAAPPGRPVGLCEKDGVRLFARGIQMTVERSARFDGLGGFDDGSLFLSIGCRLDRGDAAALAGFENVAAKDDLGNLLVSEDDAALYGGEGGEYPDEWSGRVRLVGAHPEARKLVWVVGDLVSYHVFREHRLDVPLPTGAQPVRREVNGAVFEVAPLITSDNGEISISATLLAPRESGILPGARGGDLQLVGASGELYSSSQGGSGDSEGPDGTTTHFSVHFPPIPEPVVAARLVLEEKRDPRTLVSFRLRDIPLPHPGPFVPSPVPPRMETVIPHPPSPPPLPAPPAAGHAFRQEGGGTLVIPVRVQGQAAGEGTLSLGLALKTGADWSEVRWTDLAVGRDGTARLGELKPGTYRVLRAYHPRQAPHVSTEGRWRNNDAEITVAAGKVTEMPPLSWEPLVRAAPPHGPELPR